MNDVCKTQTRAQDDACKPQHRTVDSGTRFITPPSPAEESAPTAVDQLSAILAPFRCTVWNIRSRKLLLLGTDLFALWLAFFFGRAATWITSDLSFIENLVVWWQESGSARVAVFAAITTAITLWFWGVLGHYVRFKPYWDEIREALGVVIVGFCIDAMLVFFGKWNFSRLWLLSTWGLALIFLPFARLIVKRWFNSTGRMDQPYVIIGCGPEVEEAAAALGSEPLMGFRPVATIRPCKGCSRTCPCFGPSGTRIPTIPLDNELEAYLSTPSPLHIVIVLDNTSAEPLRMLAQRLTAERDDVFIIPPLNGLPLLGMELCHFFSHEVMFMRARNNLSRNTARIAKRGFDIVVSIILLALLAPVMLVIAAKVRRDGGTATYGHVRIGMDGREFSCLKFRSMVVNSGEVLVKHLATNPDARREWERNFKLKNDPRITRVGAFLRKTSLDELPQLINVLRGEMSLVGPRPVVKAELERYGELVNFYLKVRPGMSGLWQISGRSETDYDRRVWLDRWYVQNWSLWSDLVILIRTIRVVLCREGAY